MSTETKTIWTPEKRAQAARIFGLLIAEMAGQEVADALRESIGNLMREAVADGRSKKQALEMGAKILDTMFDDPDQRGKPSDGDDALHFWLADCMESP